MAEKQKTTWKTVAQNAKYLRQQADDTFIGVNVDARSGVPLSKAAPVIARSVANIIYSAMFIGASVGYSPEQLLDMAQDCDAAMEAKSHGNKEDVE